MRVRRGRLLKAECKDGRNRQHRARRDQERRPHAEHLPQHQEHDCPDAHLERDRTGRKRSVPRRDEVGHQRLKGRPLDVDAGVEQHHCRNQPSRPGHHRRGKDRHAGRCQHEPRENDDQAAAPAGARAIRCRARPGHEQEKQDVVDRHHRPDGGAPLPDRGLHEQRDERAQERARDTREESAKAHDDAGAIRNAGRSDRFRRGVRDHQGRR